MKMKSEREVAQSCLTLHDPMDCSLPGSSVHGIFQARVLEWGAITFSDMVLRMVIIQQRFLKVKLKHEILFLPHLRVQNKTASKEVLYVKDVENKSDSMGSKGAIA